MAIIVIYVYMYNKSSFVKEQNCFKIGAVFQNKGGFSPYYFSSFDNVFITNMMYSGLVMYDNSGNVVPELAESYVIASDYKSIRFVLRDNIYFHDGTLVTTKDIKYTFDNIISRKYSNFQCICDFIERSEIISPREIIFYLKQVYPIPEYFFTTNIISSKEEFNEEKIKSNPNGTGMFELFKQDNSDGVFLKRYKRHFDNIKSNIDFLYYKFYPDKKKEWAGFLRGEIDFFYNPDSIQLKEIENSKWCKVISFPDLRYHLINLNIKNEFLRDIDVREVIDLAIDRKEILEKVFNNKGRVISSPCGAMGYTEVSGMLKASNSLKSAYNILISKGFIDSDNDGILEKNGKSFHLKLIINTTVKELNEIAKLIKLHLKKIGIYVEIEKIDNIEEYYMRLEKEQNFDLAFDEKLIYFADPWAFIFWTKDFGTEPYILEKSDLFAEIFWKLLLTKKESEKIRYVSELISLIKEEKKNLFLCYPVKYVAFNNDYDFSGIDYAHPFNFNVSIPKITKTKRR